MKILDKLKELIKKIPWKAPSATISPSKLKGLSAFLVLALVIGLSWYYFSSRSPRPDKSQQEETYQFIQNQFQLMIDDLATKQITDYRETVFHDIRIEDNSTDLSALKVFFHYTLIDKAGDETGIKGEAEIRKSPNEEEDLWLVTNFQVTDSFLELVEPMIIKAKSPPSSDKNSATKPSAQEAAPVEEVPEEEAPVEEAPEEEAPVEEAP